MTTARDFVKYHSKRKEQKMSDWKLIEVTEEPAWQEDTSGVYVVVHRVVTKEVHKGIAGERITVRVDLMSSNGDEPIISWVGKAESVRKAMMQWIGRQSTPDGFYRYLLSAEHAAYIGSEIARAEIDPQYHQS